MAEKGGEGKEQKINCIIWLFGPPLIGFLNGVLLWTGRFMDGIAQLYGANNPALNYTIKGHLL